MVHQVALQKHHVRWHLELSVLCPSCQRWAWSSALPATCLSVTVQFLLVPNTGSLTFVPVLPYYCHNPCPVVGWACPRSSTLLSMISLCVSVASTQIYQDFPIDISSICHLISAFPRSRPVSSQGCTSVKGVIFCSEWQLDSEAPLLQLKDVL